MRRGGLGHLYRTTGLALCDGDAHWYPDRRKEMESSLLDEYHDTLVAHGVQGYDRRALEADYRLSVLWRITTPVWQAVHNIPAVIWWNNLERIMLAVDDLDCRSLLN